MLVSFTLAVVFVLLGSVATELRWGGRHNLTFKRHNFLVLTVKEWLKLVYFYQSYPKNKSRVPLILDHPIYLSISTPLFILGHLHISETIRARELKFGTLVDIYEC